MRLLVLLIGLSVALLTSAHAVERTTRSASRAATAQPINDPFSFLEETEGKRALDWVQARNGETLSQMAKSPAFVGHHARALALLTDVRRIAEGRIQGDSYVQFWQDARNPRGIWRRSPLRSFLSGRPEWETLLDLDALSIAESQPWVWRGADCLAPYFDRCLIRLARQGREATSVREYDPTARRFVHGGFHLPEARSTATWYDDDTLLVGTDFGPGSLTDARRPRLVKIWPRGTPLEDARTVFAGEPADLGMKPSMSVSSGGLFHAVTRAKNEAAREFYHLGWEQNLVRSALPDDAEALAFFQGRLVAKLGNAWRYNGVIYPAGSLVAYPMAPLLGRARRTAVELAYAPPKGSAVRDAMAARDVLYITVSNGAATKLISLRKGAPSWETREITLGSNASGRTIDLVTASDISDIALIRCSGLLLPDEIILVGRGRPKRVATQPSSLDPTLLRVERRVFPGPGGLLSYTLIRRRQAATPQPTLLQIVAASEEQSTGLDLAAQLWLERGGTLAIARLPQADSRLALLNEAAGVQALAQDLVRNGITTPAQLGLSAAGRDAIAAALAWIELPNGFGGIILDRPLADMRRYVDLGAGSRWRSRYGDPRDPAQWAALERLSPYHRVSRQVRYPRPLLLTATLDDSSHPAHARKLAARLRDLGQPYLFHEQPKAGGSPLAEKAYRAALIAVYLDEQLRKPAVAQR